MKKLLMLSITAAVFITCSVFPSWIVYAADEVVDQSFLPAFYNEAWEICCWQPLGQQFVPSKTPLVAVDVEITGFDPSGDATLTVNIHEGSIDSPVILATASKIVAQDFTGLLHFEFASPLAVTPGNLYILELTTNNRSHAWCSIRAVLNYEPGCGIVGGGSIGNVDHLFQTYTLADTAPTVQTTSPADGATNVPINSNISLTFSEPVNVVGPWYSIVGSTSGIHTAMVTGGPTSFVLDPDTDFAGSETCTITVYDKYVTDQDTDDPYDNMTADFTFSFSTAGGTGPTTPEVGGDIYPVNKFMMFAPVIIFAIALLSGTILVFKRRRIQS